MNTRHSPIARNARRLVVIAGAALAITGCATTNAPTDQIAVTRSAVSDAVSAGAPQYAPVALRSAHDKLDAANAAMAAYSYDDARRLADEAQADANLASATARSVKAQQAAAEVQQSIRDLALELSRSVQQP